MMSKYLCALLVAVVTFLQITTVDSQLQLNKKFLTAKIKRTITRKFSSTNGTNARIVGGEVATPNEFPFEVLIVGVQFIPLNLKVCAGSIVSQKYILSSADCFYDAATGQKYNESYIWVVVAGAHDINALSDSIPELYYASTITIHEDYDFSTKANDIALIELVNPGIVAYTETISNICLASGAVPPVGMNLEIAGWGRIEGQPDDSYNRLLHKTNVIVECDSFCEATVTSPAVYDPASLFCAQNTGKSFCKGDEGGPAFVKNGTYFIQYGIIAYQDGCGEPNKPGFYTRVSHFKQWIENLTGCLTCP